MALRTIRLLHVEDDEAQRRVTAHHLTRMAEYAFLIECVAGEEAALETFRHQRTDFVLLDYQLTEGNGLSCLRRLRELDAQVPIVAISGTANTETAAELLYAGADDYLSKLDLRSDVLARSIRVALARADAWRQRGRGKDNGTSPEIKAAWMHLGQAVLTWAGPELLQQLDVLETSTRKHGLTPAQLEASFGEVCAELSVAREMEEQIVQRLLRAFLLELLLRIAGLSGSMGTPEPEVRHARPAP